jgi:DNA repair protein RecO (recombination protein O)
MPVMTLISDQGVVLRRLDYSETSQVLVVFTRSHGKVRAIAKGAKRSTRTRFAVGVDLLEAGDLVVSIRSARQQELATLTEWKQRRAFAALRDRLARLYAAQYSAEVTAGLTEDWDPHEQLYQALLALLERLCEADQTLPPLVAFLTEMLSEVGVVPRFEACVSCHRPISPPRQVHFSSFEGGLLCRDCEGAFVEKRLVPLHALPVLQGHRSDNQKAQRSAFEVLNYHVSHLMGRAPLLATKVLSA